MTRQLENRMTSRSFVMELVEKALIDHEAVCTSKETSALSRNYSLKPEET